MEKCTLSNKELADKVSEGISELCKTGGKSFTMHVPARLNEDLDLIVSEMVSRFRVLALAKKTDASENTLPLQSASGLLPLTKEWIDKNNSNKTGLIKCRECNDFVLYYKDNYCSNCGKKPLWQ